MSDDLVTLSKSIIQKGSKSFAMAARLFDPETRAGAYLLYAWCRHCDDVIDGQDLGFDSPKKSDPKVQLQRLKSMTAEALEGKPMTDPIFAAFQKVAAKYQIPSQHPFALLDGFAMDVTGRQYETLDDTLSYCYHVAGVVGVMMAMVMGKRGDETLDRASDLGLAFQLTNLARDVTDDAATGRCYLPRRWLNDAGLSDRDVADAKYRSKLFNVVERLLAEADRYYDSALVGLSDLPVRSRWAIATARNVYRAIGTEVRARGANAWDKRVSTSKGQKLGAAVGGLATAFVKPQPQNASRVGLWTRPR